MTFHVGQKVVCVARTIHPLAEAHPGLVVGRVYTVIDVVLHSTWKTPGLLLAEIAPREPQYCAFESLLFRPIVERKTSIEIFKAMLNPSKRSVDA